MEKLISTLISGGGSNTTSFLTDQHSVTTLGTQPTGGPQVSELQGQSLPWARSYFQAGSFQGESKLLPSLGAHTLHPD